MTRFEQFLNLLRAHHIEYKLDDWCRSINLYPKNQDSFMDVATTPLGSEFLSHGEIVNDRIHIHFASVWLSSFPEAFDKSINLPLFLWCGRRAYKSGETFDIQRSFPYQELIVKLMPYAMEPHYQTAKEIDAEIETYSDTFGRKPDILTTQQKKGLIFQAELTWKCTNEEWADLSRPLDCLDYRVESYASPRP